MDSRTHLRSLLVMAMADGELEDAELTFLIQRCRDLDLTEAQLRDAILFAMDDDAAIHLPSSPVDQEMLLRDLMQMMCADQIVDEREKRLFALVAAKLGFDRHRLAELLNLKPSD